MAGPSLVFALLLGVGTADAAINRCMGLDGVLVFTDRTCASLGTAQHLDSGTPRAAPMPRRRVGSARPVSKLVGFGCAANSPEALRVAVIDAIDRRDFNALSGLYNFDGRSRHTAAAVVRRLERMAKRSATEVELVVAQSEYWFDMPMPDPAALPQLRVVQHSEGSVGLSIESFKLARSAGCLWLGG